MTTIAHQEAMDRIATALASLAAAQHRIADAIRHEPGHEPGPVIAAIYDLSRNLRRIAEGETVPSGLEGLTMVIGGDPQRGDSVTDALKAIAMALEDLKEGS